MAAIDYKLHLATRELRMTARSSDVRAGVGGLLMGMGCPPIGGQWMSAQSRYELQRTRDSNRGTEDSIATRRTTRMSLVKQRARECVGGSSAD